MRRKLYPFRETRGTDTFLLLLLRGEGGISDIPPRTDFAMSRATPQMRYLAQQILTYEGGANPASLASNTLHFNGVKKLSPYFVALLGAFSFRLILERALAAASEEVPWLSQISINDDDMLQGFDGPGVPIVAETVLAGWTVLLACLLELLITFTGETMTLRMLRDVWPQVSKNDLNLPPRRSP